MRERSERVESPGSYVTERVSRCHFSLALCYYKNNNFLISYVTGLLCAVWMGHGRQKYFEKGRKYSFP